MVFDFIVAISCVVIGLSLGWVAHALYRSGALSPIDPAVSAGEPSGEPSAERRSDEPEPATLESITPEKVTSVASRIQSFVATITANIDSHQTKVDAVSTTLSECDLSDASPVIVNAVEQLLSANELMREQLQESQERLREQSKQLESAEQRAQTDALTGITNRGAFDERLREQFKLGPHRAAVLVLADIDYFKRFNDEHGHRAGDEVLRGVARMLEARLQPYGTVGRFGGEEFAMLIDSSDFKETLELIEATRVAVSTREIRFEGKRLRVSLSIGIGRLEANQAEGDWVQRVDDALYRSKETGRNCSHYVAGERLLRVNDLQPISVTSSAMTNRVGATIQADATNRAVTDRSTEVDRLSDPINDRADLDGAREPELAIQSNVAVLAQSAREATTVKSSAVESTELGHRKTNIESVIDVAATATPATGPSLAQPIDDLVMSLSLIKPTQRPKALSYLPDRDALVDDILETFETRRVGNRPHFLMAVTLSGQPSGALMRSLLQIVRAAIRSQDRIGCVNHSTLMVHLAECEETDVYQRAEQICLSAGSVGVELASPRGNRTQDRLSIGALKLSDHVGTTELPLSIETMEQILVQAQATAMLAGRHSEQDGTLPIFVHESIATASV